MPAALAGGAVLLVLGGCALLLWRSDGTGRRRAVRVLGLLIAIGGGLALVGYATDPNLGLDALIPTIPPATPGTADAAGLAFGGAFALLAGGLALAMLGRTWRRWHAAEVLGVTCAFIGAFDLLAHLYGVPAGPKIWPEATGSLPIAIGTLALGVGVIAADEDHGLVRLLRDPGIAGRSARRILPAVLLIAPVVGWSEVAAQRAGLVDDPLGTLAMVAAAVGLGWVIAWWRVVPGRAAEHALSASLDRLRALYGSLSDAVFVQADPMSGPPDGSMPRFLDVNDIACQRLGYTREELLSMTPNDIDAPESGVDLGPIVARIRAGETVVFEQIHMAKDGTRIPVEISARPFTLEGRPAVITLARDSTERKRADAARAAAEASLRESERNLARAQRIAGLGSWERVVATGELRWSAESYRLFGLEPGTIGSVDEFLARIHPDDRHLAVVHRDVLDAGRRDERDYRIIRPDGVVRTIHEEAEAVRDETGEPVLYVGILQDVTDRVRAEHDRARLISAVEQSPESIIITDPAGSIEYVNAAFEHTTGYSRDEVVGKNPRILKSGRQSPAFYEAMWAALSAGQTWVADLVNRRKDGQLIEEEAVISPVRDERGVATGFVAVQRDVTRDRAAEARASRAARERSTIAQAIGHAQANDGPEATARAICGRVVTLSGLFMAGIFIFELDGRATPLAIATADGGDPPLRPLPYRRSEYLRDRAGAGPWVENWADRPWHPYNRVTREAGIDEVGIAPLHHGGALFGILVASKQPSLDARMSENLPALVEFAGLAGATLGPAVAGRTEVARVRAGISADIAEHRFHPVFQPIVDVRHGRVVAYEALTRFDDGVAPDSRFEEASRVGLGIDLEQATLEAALDAARGLRPHAWLHLNASPALIERHEPLASILATTDRHTVLEVTEHSKVEDYAAFRQAMATLGPRVSLAVDDAGAGYASLRHVLELRPAFVKLDRSLIAGLDTDPARQAMVAGMSQFADEMRCRLVAEGVETDAELQELRRRGVRLVQGFLMGRPARLASDAGVEDAPSRGAPQPADGPRRGPGTSRGR